MAYVDELLVHNLIQDTFEVKAAYLEGESIESDVEAKLKTLTSRDVLQQAIVNTSSAYIDE